MDQTAPSPITGNTVLAFVYWFFVAAPHQIIRIWQNYLAAVLHYFSIPVLLRTLVAPWHRDVEQYPPGELGLIVRAFLINQLTRIIGMLIRLTTILIGLAVELLFIVIGIMALIGWYLAPVILLWLLSAGPNVPHLALPHLFAIHVRVPALSHGSR